MKKSIISTFGLYLLPISAFALLNLIEIPFLKAEESKGLCLQQNVETEQTTQAKNIEQSQANKIWCEANSWTIDSNYKINSELKMEETIDWDKLEVNFDSDLELNF